MKVKADRKVPPGNHDAQVKSVHVNGKGNIEMDIEVLPPGVTYLPFSEPVRDWYCDAKGCTNEFVSRLSHESGKEYKFCAYHWGVILHHLIEMAWVPLQEVLQADG